MSGYSRLMQVQKARIPSMWDDMQVALEATVYHDPRKLHNTVGMKLLPEWQAFYEEDATPCSECFEDQEVGAYPNTHLREINV